MEKLPSAESPVAFPDLAKEMQAMCAVDQDMRERSLQDDSLWDKTVDARHTERMKEIVAQIGWPTVSKVGAEGAKNAWLLVQHADHDVEFQESCLELMLKEPETEVRRWSIAMLTDRVRVNRGRPQVYGTQFEQVNGQHVPREIEDAETVNERRASMGMRTLEEGIAEMYEKYGPPDPDDEA